MAAPASSIIGINNTPRRSPQLARDSHILLHWRRRPRSLLVRIAAAAKEWSPQRDPVSGNPRKIDQEPARGARALLFVRLGRPAASQGRWRPAAPGQAALAVAPDEAIPAGISRPQSHFGVTVTSGSRPSRAAG